MSKELNIYLAGPRGFCAGVDRAIEMVKEALKKYGQPVYVRHEIVHNKYVVENLKSEGAVFIEELNEIKDIVKKHQGYVTLIKVEEDLKASADIFTIDPIKYKISEKIKRSFDPKRIFNPGKMYTGI